ncbi:peptidoglycan editing factor PgeF [Vibrio vulnificus]|nr:peptidoglycan editing factor PgeF [Vibrio vulnificus]PNG63096.1 polyphenol oxidase [Vibrio vulnificus]POC09084.1 multi-copper polyphenol oxidoreductase [Vibrio vulnificus]POC76503.1 multi-copper polyphenol oxidoreductase [Vibrio vulnificus]HAS8108752.1 peptidoglycan editing factor PgeF [Vibrio vulnificus]
MMIIPNWPAPKNVKALSTTRQGGYSTGVYAGLNLGTHVGDDFSIVMRNRLWLAEQAQMPSAPIWLNQTHSTTVMEATVPTEVILDADGVFTHSSGVVCSAMTADCLPVLITNTSGTQVAAVHAGWRGLAGGIVEEALRHFSQDVLIWLGPAIGPQAFEVGDDVVEAFCQQHPQAVNAFSAHTTPNKWLADMDQLARIRLSSIGVEAIYSSKLCTYQDSRFYSYRREGTTGRQASFIWFE